MTVLNIVPECFVDTKVAEILGQAKKFNHQHGCGDVANQLKTTLKDKTALGIIDEDKNKGPAAKYFSEFNIIAEQNELILKKHNQRKQYLIMICPDIEKWLFNNAVVVNLDPTTFNLPEKLSGLKIITKTQNIDRNIGFYRFIKEMIRKDAPGIVTLKKWIEAFNNNTLPIQ